MRKRIRRRGVGEIVGGNIDRLNRRDRTLGRAGDAFLQGAHVGRQRGLIPDRGGNAAEQRGNLRSRLGKAENIVDEEQHVLPLVAEIFRHRQTGKADARARPRGLVHLAIDQRAF